MALSEIKIHQLLQTLDRLGRMEAAKLSGQFTDENINAMRLLSSLLKEDMDLEQVLSEKRFISVVGELFETRKMWSERLEETLKNAYREFEMGNRVQALWILNGFIRFCPSPYYRDRAGEVMEEYERSV
ncbi:MAG: hypothetical protein JSV70_06705 [bacterium]|nr:MAG: hypothetical protein JSV70_06705 [bacterium]